jgi:hypothetical protein
MHYLIYISSAAKLMEQNELSEILAVSRKNNTIADVTGMLLYSQGTFIQALEGEEEVIKNLYAKIEHDKRHKSVIMLIEGKTDKRTFPNWSMAFLTLNPSQLTQLEGYINPTDKQLFEPGNKNTMITVMRTFAENNNLLHL